jgi:hypothetical protein
LHDFSQALKKGHDVFEFSNNGFMDHELLSVARNNKMMRTAFVEASTQEIVGPLITSHNVLQVVRTYYNYRDSQLSDIDRFRGAERALSCFASAAMKKAKKIILQKSSLANDAETLIDSEIANYQDNTGRLQEMVVAYDKAQIRYKSFRQEKKRSRRASYTRQQKKEHEKRLKSGMKVLANIMEVVSSSSTINGYYQRFAWVFDCQFDHKGKYSRQGKSNSSEHPSPPEPTLV